MTVTTLRSERRSALMEAMRGAAIDGLLVYGNAWHADSLRYATDFGIQEGQALAFVDNGGRVTILLDDPVEKARAQAETGCEVICVKDLPAAARDLALASGKKRLAGAPYRLLPYGLVRDMPADRLRDGSALLETLVMNKSGAENECVRRAAALADRGYEVFRHAARPGRRDYELIAEVESFFRSEGIAENFMIIGVGGVDVRGMTPPSGRILQAGDLVTTELTPCVEGYYAQICRTLVVGRPSALQRKSFAVFQESLAAGLATVKADVPAAAIAKAENDVFRKYGLGDFVTSEYTRVRGHGIGLFVDQKPQILEDVPIPVRENMSIIVHPNTYHPDVGYMVLGDTLIVTRDGYECPGATSRDLLTV